MNVYDFDKTIFYPDSSFSFLKYCFRKYPREFLSNVPNAVLSSSKEEMKESFFSIISYIPDIDELVKEFWDRKIGNIQTWYYSMRKDDDLVISASPEFLIKSIADRIGFEYLATPMNKYSAKIMGANCHGEEKLKRFYQKYPNGHIDNFYSDSLSDYPLAEIADNAYLVINGHIIKWPRF